jgi:thymidylate synthase
MGRNQMKTIKEIREAFVEKLEDGDFVNGTIELIGESFIADEDSIFGKVNQDYVDRELTWYLSESLNVNDIPGGAPKIWVQHASNNFEINSNYGFLIYNENNGNQYINVMSKLLADETTRQATMIYTRPSMHTDWNRDEMSDFICTNTVQYLIRDDKLDVVVQMRSNDVVFGYRNDYAWQKHVRDSLIKDLQRFDKDLEPGTIYWNAASLHVYERHYKLIKHYDETGDAFMDVKS